MLRSIIQLTRIDKPIGTLLLLWPTLSALFLAATKLPSIHVIIVFSLGVFLTRSAGCVINDIFDQKYDKNVLRTKNRPLANGQLTTKVALIVFAFLTISAFVLAITNLRFNTVLLTLPALFIFITYPLMKRFFKVPQAYLALAFSMGILMAFMELDGYISLIGWLYFIANMCWVLGYDTIYALEDIEDDKQIKIHSSAQSFGDYVVYYVAFFYLLFWGLLITIGVLSHFGVKYYLFMFIIFLLLYVQIVTIYKQHSYLRMFKLNNWVGLLMFMSIFLSID